MAVMLEDGPGNERDYYLQYIKHLKAETVHRFLQTYDYVNVDFMVLDL